MGSVGSSGDYGLALNNDRQRFRKSVGTVAGVIVFVMTCLAVIIGSTPGLKAQGTSHRLVLLFEDDFATSELGSIPEGWEPERLPLAQIQVVRDDIGGGGRALHITADPAPRTDIGIKGPPLENVSDDLTIVVVEFDLRHIKGSLNSYVMAPNLPTLHWSVGATGHLTARGHSVGPLNEGWNRIRILADRSRNEMFVYLNDLDSPAAGPLSFREPTETWEGARLRFMHVVSEEMAAEAYYSNVRIWGIE